MGTVRPNKVGVVFGVLGGGWHFLWALLVALGWAQALMNFVFWMHFLAPPYVVQPFHLNVALILVVITALLGYAMGYILACLWNWIQR
jgi:hypothetical protein